MRAIFAPYRGKDLEDFQPQNESQAAALAALSEYVKDMDQVRLTGLGLTLLGPNGVGKTMLASAVLAVAQEQGYRIEAIELASYVGLFKDKFACSELLRSDYDEAVDRYVKLTHHIRYIKGDTRKGADWLLLDDVGREYESKGGWSQQELFDTLRFRWNRHLPTIITTNAPIADLERRYTEGLTSLLAEATQVIVIEGDDYRWRKGS